MSYRKFGVNEKNEFIESTLSFKIVGIILNGKMEILFINLIKHEVYIETDLFFYSIDQFCLYRLHTAVQINILSTKLT